MRGHLARVAGAIPLVMLLAACGSSASQQNSGDQNNQNQAQDQNQQNQNQDNNQNGDQDNNQNNDNQNQDQGDNQNQDRSQPLASTSAIPRYEPSAVVGSHPGEMELKSPSSVGSVNSFYKQKLDTGGWKLSSSHTGSYNGYFLANKGNDTAKVVIRTGGPTGSWISVISYRH